MAYKDKDAQRAYGKAYQIARRAQAKADRVCVRCLGQDDRTLRGRAECAFCAKKRALRRIEKLEEQKRA